MYAPAAVRAALRCRTPAAAAWLCTNCDKHLDEFDDHAHACERLKGAHVTRHIAVRNILHTAAYIRAAERVCTRSAPTLLSLGAVPKPELRHHTQTDRKVPEHRADVTVIPVSDPDRGVYFADTLIFDVTVTAATSTLNTSDAGPTTDEETNVVAAGGVRPTDKAAERSTTELELAAHYLYVQKGNLVPVVLEMQSFLHARGRLLLCKIAWVQTVSLFLRPCSSGTPPSCCGTCRRRTAPALPAFNEMADEWYSCSVFVA
jgi:hypothetical protein